MVITKSSFVSPSLSPLNMSTETSTGSNVVSLSTFAFFFFCFLYVNVECSLIVHVGDFHDLRYDVDAYLCHISNMSLCYTFPKFTLLGTCNVYVWNAFNIELHICHDNLG